MSEGRVYLVPVECLADPEHPTVAELDQFQIELKGISWEPK